MALRTPEADLGMAGVRSDGGGPRLAWNHDGVEFVKRANVQWFRSDPEKRGRNDTLLTPTADVGVPPLGPAVAECCCQDAVTRAFCWTCQGICGRSVE